MEAFAHVIMAVINLAIIAMVVPVILTGGSKILLFVIVMNMTFAAVHIFLLLQGTALFNYIAASTRTDLKKETN